MFNVHATRDETSLLEQLLICIQLVAVSLGQLVADVVVLAAKQDNDGGGRAQPLETGIGNRVGLELASLERAHTVLQLLRAAVQCLQVQVARVHVDVFALHAVAILAATSIGVEEEVVMAQKATQGRSELMPFGTGWNSLRARMALIIVGGAGRMSSGADTRSVT